MRTDRVTKRFESASGPAVAAGVGLAYFGLAQYVIWLNDPVNAGAGYWPAAGVTLAVLLLVPERRWPWALAGIVVAEIGGSSAHGYPLAACAWWAAGNAVEPLVAATLLRRTGRAALSPIPDLVRFLIAGVLIGPLVGALVGAVGTSSEFGDGWLDVALKWWAGDGLGVLVVAPALLCFREPAGPRRRRLEAVALGIVIVVVPLLAFRSWQPEWDVVLPYLLFPLLMWASVRFGIRGAAVAGLVVAEVTNVATALGYGPFHFASLSGHTITVLQIFLGTALTAGLIVAAFITDAMGRASALQRQRAVADALQQAVLPERLPQVSGMAFAARYEPATDDAIIQVGGDWYDAFALPSGALALVVGDVAGHDLGAAVVMGQLRNGLRSLFIETEDPARVLAALDRQLAAANGPIASTICARYCDGTLTWSNAGHPPLLVVGRTGPSRYLDDDPSPMLGLGTSTYATHTTALEEGSLVVAFTDGLIEHRTWSLVDALRHLADVADATTHRDAESLCDVVLASGLGGRRRDDDACVLVMQRL